MAYDMKIGEQRVWRRELVTVFSQADANYKVVVKLQDGTYRLAHMTDLQLIPEARFHAWWTKGGTTLILRRTDNDGTYTNMSIPKEVMVNLRQVMFSKKANIRDSMRPIDIDEAEKLEGEEEVPK